ncbi:MAG: thioredoxin [Verrucomicrobiae bacterium]|nr:thioredoxin [Verrucomicrobiae bacterium]
MSHEVSDFQKEVIARSREVPVVVDFWAPWCGPCRMLGPVIEKLASESGGRWDLVKVNTDHNPDIARQYQIRGIPNLKLFIDGRVVGEAVGAQPEPMLRQWIDRYLPTASA